MRNLKRALSLALAAVMLIGMMALGTSAASVSDFNDAGSITHTEAASVIAGLQIAAGYEDGSFRPDSIVTRAEMAVFVSKMLHGSTIDPSMFADEQIFSDYDGWSNGWVNLAYTDGVISGRGDGIFDPKSTVTVLEATTMILKALGVDYDANNWSISVMTKASELGLFGDMTPVGSQGMTRDMMAALTFEALIYSPSGERTYTCNGETFDSAAEAFFYQQTLPGDPKPAVVPSTAKDSLGSRIFGLTVTTNSTDDFGRTATAYTSTKNEYKDLNVLIASSTPTYVYTSAVADANGLGLAKNTTLEGGSVTPIVDNKAGVAVATLDALADLTSDDAIVEVYTSGSEITKIIKIITHIDTVASVTEADDDHDASIVLTTADDTEMNTINVEGFKEGDVVLFTRSYDGSSKYDLVDIKLADSFVGTMTRYTNNGQYTINGSVYTVADTGLTGFSANPSSYLGKEKVYFLDNNNEIINVADVDDSVEMGEYVYVLGAHVEATGAVWPASATSVTAQIQVVLTDGSVAIFDLPLKKTGSNYYVEIKDGSDILVYNGSAVQTANVDGMEDTVYACSIDGNKISLGELPTAYDSSAASKGDTVSVTADASIVKNAVSVADDNGEDVLINNNTTFVLVDNITNPEKPTATVVVGSANLGDTTIAKTDATAIIAGVTEDKDQNKVAVANLVFANVVYDGGSNVDETDYIYVTGDYFTEKQGNDTVYVFTAYRTDGSVIEVSSETSSVTPGIYTYASDTMELDAAVEGANVKLYATVSLVSGSTVYTDVTNFTVNADTKVAIAVKNGELKAGAHVAYVLGTGSKATIASVVFVVPEQQAIQSSSTNLSAGEFDVDNVTFEINTTAHTVTLKGNKRYDCTINAANGVLTGAVTLTDNKTALVYDSSYDAETPESNLKAAGALVAGDKIVVTAEDGTIQAYTVAIEEGTDATLADGTYNTANDNELVTGSTVTIATTKNTSTGTITVEKNGTGNDIKACDLLAILGDAYAEIYYKDGGDVDGDTTLTDPSAATKVASTSTDALANGQKIVVLADDGTTKIVYTVSVS